MTDEDLIKRIQDALGTAEEGEALVGVARDAHAAELELAAILRTRHPDGGPIHINWSASDDWHRTRRELAFLRTALGANFCDVVGDVDEVIASLKANGLTVDRDKARGSDGSVQLRVR